MDINNTFIKPVLLFHYGKGKSEIETHEEIVKQYGKYAICLKTINKWFTEFRKGKHISSQAKQDTKEKISNEVLIELVDNNPQLTMEELGKLAGVNKDTISRRLKQINSEGEIVSYIYKKHKKTPSKENGVFLRLTDEFIIGLVNKNPDLCMRELAALADISQSTLSKRLKAINSDEEKVKYVNKTSRGKYSETSAKPASTPKPKPKPIIKFTDEYLIDLINKNPELSIRELAEIIGSSTSTVSRRIRQINANEGKVIYAKKNFLRDNCKTKPKPKPEISDQNLIEIVNNNPNLNMKELAALVETSPLNLSKKMKQINWINARINYCNDRSKKCQKSRPRS
jgi:DNA-binding MarR family transcriptional regulator